MVLAGFCCAGARIPVRSAAYVLGYALNVFTRCVVLAAVTAQLAQAELGLGSWSTHKRWAWLVLMAASVWQGWWLQVDSTLLLPLSDNVVPVVSDTTLYKRQMHLAWSCGQLVTARVVHWAHHLLYGGWVHGGSAALKW